MARIVSVHGIGQQLKGPHTLKDTWLPAMRDGLALADAAVPTADDLICTFYGDLFGGLHQRNGGAVLSGQ